MRPILLACLLCSTASLADEVDLTRSAARGPGNVPTLVLRLEGGSSFSPCGYVGGVVSYLIAGQFEIEAGLGAGFPGLQGGLALRTVFGEEGEFLLGELSVAGNSRVDRSLSAQVNAGPTQSSLWTSFGFGAELRQGLYDFDVVGSIVFTTEDLTPRFALHGGVGVGF